MNENVLSGIIYAAQFSVAATIICIGILVLAATAIILNQLFNKYWIPVNLFRMINDALKPEDPSKKKDTQDHGKN